ncbi:PREDICTED: WD repeat-containing protein KIAA1875-like [Condylura cristata]|uniref:WD repeat-containing protein KIAA1875-like n=1 Tax=Condylura cristata TaxID=143302 RepID=UPI0006432B9B|nr:PREDICTED: WD repeat-containing protein KIAA1875-like [Condylura cristata]
MAPCCQLALGQDLKDLIARDQDLQQLRWGLLAPKAQRPPSGERLQEAFENYLRLIYGPCLLVGVGGLHAGGEPPQDSSMAFAGEVGALSRVAPGLRQTGFFPEERAVPTDWPPQAPGALCKRLVHLPGVLQLSPPTYQPVHSQASQLLARSSLSSCLGLSLDLLLREERRRQLQQRGRTPGAQELPASQLQRRVPLLPERRPQDPLSKLGGFFPATVSSCERPRLPIHFPSYVPNSVVLQRLWPWSEVSGLGALPELVDRPKSKAQAGGAGPAGAGGSWGCECSPPSLQRGRREDSLWLLGRRRHRRWQPRPIPGDQEPAWDAQYLPWSSGSVSPRSQLSDLLESREPETPPSAEEPHGPQDIVAAQTSFPPRHLLWEDRYEQLPQFLHFFVIQNWFKKLFPFFTLEMYPEGATTGGLASLFMDLLAGTPWAERVHILWALLRLLPDLSRELCGRLQQLYLPASYLVKRRFVILALQLLLACSLDSREVVLELMAYFLCSPASCRWELKQLLDGLGLKDPQGLLFKDMMSWVQAHNIRSKATLRRYCAQKLETMARQLKVQVELLASSAAALADMLPRASRPLALPCPPEETLSRVSVVSSTPSGSPSVIWMSPTAGSPGDLDLATAERLALQLLPGPGPWPTHRRLSDALLPFASSARAQPGALQLGPARPWPLLRVAALPPADQRLSQDLWRADHPIRMLKLPLPRVELRPFPPDWPRPARPRPPRPLQPALQRYFLPGNAVPDHYR